MDEALLFDSDDDEDSKKKTQEERKFIFRRELKSMLYGFGDDKVLKFLKKNFDFGVQVKFTIQTYF